MIPAFFTTLLRKPYYSHLDNTLHIQHLSVRLNELLPVSLPLYLLSHSTQRQPFRTLVSLHCCTTKKVKTSDYKGAFDLLASAVMGCRKGRNFMDHRMHSLVIKHFSLHRLHFRRGYPLLNLFSISKNIKMDGHCFSSIIPYHLLLYMYRKSITQISSSLHDHIRPSSPLPNCFVFPVARPRKSTPYIAQPVCFSLLVFLVHPNRPTNPARGAMYQCTLTST